MVDYESSQITEQLRLVLFLSIVVLLALLEKKLPRRQLVFDKRLRWLNNFSLGIMGSLLLYVCLPLLAVEFAGQVVSRQIGLFHWLSWPWGVEFVLSILLLDLGIYWQHRLFHKVPLLWAVHRVHHSDLDLDLSSAVRFHPLELLLSMFIKFLLIVMIGPAVLAVLIFEILLNGAALFNHANIQLPHWLDRRVRLMVVTPDMHRIHHSVFKEEMTNNYGFFLSIWDRLFSSYQGEPRDGHQRMKIGLSWIKGDRAIKIKGLLREPFVSDD